MSKCKITGKVLAIQLGREDTQIVLLDKGKQILHTVSVATPVGAMEDGMIRNADAVRIMLKTVLKEEPAFKNVRQAVFVLSTSQVISETVTTPNLPEAKLEKLLRANMDMYFLVDMQDYELVWQPVGPVVKENGLTELAVQLWAIPSLMLSRYYNVANACGLSVVAVDYCGHSVATAAGASFSGKAAAKKGGRGAARKAQEAQNEEGAVATETRYAPDTDLHLTMEKELIGMTFVQSGKVVFQRFIRCGQDPSYQFGELAMMVDYFHSMEFGRGSAVTPIVSGALCADRVLMAQLEDALGMVLADYPVAHDPRFALYVGAAATTLDFGVPAWNKPGKARREIQSQLWQYLLILAGGLVLIAVVMLLLSSRIAWTSGIGSLEAVKQTLTIQAQQTAGFADNYKAYAAKYDAYSSDWDTVFASMKTYNDNLVLVLEELEELLPKDSSVTEHTDRTSDGSKTIGLYQPSNGLFDPYEYFRTHSTSISITGLQIAADGMNIQFACESKEEAAYLIMALRDMEYAELVGITDLQGGGDGPAAGYGTGSEAAPIEGSGPTDNVLKDYVASKLSKDKLNELASSLKGEEIYAMEAAYGRPPQNSTNLEAYKAANTLLEEEFFAKRQNAMKLLLTTNPFASYRFIQDLLIEDDWDRNENGILLPLIREELFTSGADVTPAGVANIITRDDATLTAAEALICTDTSVTNVEGWYVYYLETQSSSGYPFLDMDKILADLMDDGRFSTTNSDLNKKLDALISDEDRQLLRDLNDDEKIAQMVNKYFTEGSSEHTVVDGMINAYLTTGSTGIDAVDQKIKAYLASGAMDEQIARMVDNYLETGSTGHPIVNGMVQNYLATGSTNNDDVDDIINDYLSSDEMKQRMSKMLTDYLEKGTTESEVVDDLIEKYLDTGSTGNPKLDDLIEAQLKTDAVKNRLIQLGGEYFLTGDTGIEALNRLIERYQETGDTGNPVINEMLASIPVFGPSKPDDPDEPTQPSGPVTTGHETLDELIRRYNAGTDIHNKLESIFNGYDLKDFGESSGESVEPVKPDAPAAADFGFADEQIKEMLEDYLTEKTTGDEAKDKILSDYLRHYTTGDKDMDGTLQDLMKQTWVKEAVEERVKEYFCTGTSGIDVVDEAVEDYLLNGSLVGDNQTLALIVEEQMQAGKYDSAIKERLAAFEKKDDTEEDDPFGDYSELFTQENINKLVLLYNMNGTTQIAKVDEQFSKYVKTGKTDYPLLDPMLEKAGLKVKGSSSIDDALSSLLGGGSGGSSSAATVKTDNRVFFNAVLGYSDKLMEAELIRKGLNEGDKIDKVEVEE